MEGFFKRKGPFGGVDHNIMKIIGKKKHHIEKFNHSCLPFQMMMR
jgi:hypothetical protein